MSSHLSPLPDEAFLPQIRKEFIFGPAERNRGATIYHLKDTATNWFYKIGQREYFLISCMDGTHSLEEIGKQYLAVFGKQLDERAWQQFFALLEKRQMLANTVNQDRLEELKTLSQETRKERNKGLFRRRLPLINPDHFLGSILPFLQFMFHPAFVLVVLVAVTAFEAVLFLDLPQFIEDARRIGTSEWGVLAACIALFWLFSIVHEFAHGLACKQYGGSVPEIGILWRYLAFFPYCKLDDVVLFHSRRHRIYAFFAGPFANLLAILLVGVIWWLSPQPSFVRDLSELFLLGFNVSTLMNFIPFIELDGYFMLNCALGMSDLRRESHRYWKDLALKTVLRAKLPQQNGTRREKYIYLVYGFLSLGVTGGFMLYMSLVWFFTIREWVGNLAALGIFILSLLSMLLWRWWPNKQKTQRQQKHIITTV